MKHTLRHLVRSALSKRKTQIVKAAACSLIESLESRVFLSGTVMASVVHGNLNIRGDTAANVITIDQTGLNNDQVRISGADGTAINDQADPVILSGVKHGVFIRMGNGNDSVTLSNVSLPGNVSVNAWRGTDALALNDVQVAKTLNIQTGSSFSTTTIAHTTVGTHLIMGTGVGRQDVALQSVDVKHNTRIVTGRKAAIVTIDDSVFHGAVAVSTGPAADIVQLDANGDLLGSPTLFDGPVSISMNRGDDLLQLGIAGENGNRSAFAGRTRFNGGPGHDTLANFDASNFTSKSRPSIQSFESKIVIADTTPPVVSSTDPANNAMGVALNKKIAATFSEAMDPATITAANVMVTAPGNVSILGTVAYVGTTATFTPTNPLAADITYTLTISTGAKDVAGNPLAGTYVSSFTSGSTSDTTAPTVSSTDPANNATGVALNKKIVGTFSEAMDPATIIAANVTVTTPGQVSVSGNVAYVGTTMTFTPTSPLAADTTFTMMITSGAKDLAGNPLAGNFVSAFTTGATADTTAPTVSSTDPAANATGIALNKKIAASFSEAMDPATITAANVTLAAPGQVSVLGTVTYAGTTMAFTPTHPLAPNTTFTMTIANKAKDLAGNPLANNFLWSFTTGAAPDTTAPTVASTNPIDLQTNVLINKAVNATFSESIDAQTITTATFTLTGPGNVPITGTVTYDAPSKTASFVPSSNLSPNTAFTATIFGGVNGVADLAGNPLASNKTWTFTTGSQVAQAPINLGSAGAFAVMATASISGTGATQINGNVGLNPGSAQGIPPAQVNGTIHIDDQAIIKAQSDLRAGYNDAVSRSVTSQSLPGNMGGLTFTHGLYTNSTSVLIQGAGPANNVTLDAQGDPNAIFIFKMGSTLTTGPGAQVILAGGAKASNVFWQVGTSATLNTTTIFKGNILAAVTITVNNGSAVEGRLLAGASSDGSVTINASTVTVPSA